MPGFLAVDKSKKSDFYAQQARTREDGTYMCPIEGCGRSEIGSEPLVDKRTLGLHLRQIHGIISYKAAEPKVRIKEKKVKSPASFRFCPHCGYALSSLRRAIKQVD